MVNDLLVRDEHPDVKKINRHDTSSGKIYCLFFAVDIFEQRDKLEIKLRRTELVKLG